MKQSTYLVTESNEQRKMEMAKSDLCLIRDWNLGWFEVPHTFRDEFKKAFGIYPTVENSVCSHEITMQEIEMINRRNWRF